MHDTNVLRCTRCKVAWSRFLTRTEIGDLENSFSINVLGFDISMKDTLMHVLIIYIYMHAVFLESTRRRFILINSKTKANLRWVDRTELHTVLRCEDLVITFEELEFPLNYSPDRCCQNDSSYI